MQMFLYTFLVIFTALGFFLLRNEWVYKKRLECIDDGTYHLLPDYDTMFHKFWIWDIEKFKSAQ